MLHHCGSPLMGFVKKTPLASALPPSPPFLLTYFYSPLPSLPCCLVQHWLTHKDPLLLFFSCAAGSRGPVKQRTTQNTPQLQLRSTNSSVFLWLKCATTGRSIDWNKNKQTARADQQSRRFENLTEKPWNKVRPSQLEMKGCWCTLGNTNATKYTVHLSTFQQI